ncbi:MAG: hypothetical protein GEV08_03630 [Acidimicrobiia bacterium]|nr:hypothetical protein [Acidimicrobiia bacterium]
MSEASPETAYEGPLPAVTNLNAPHWEALREHRLVAPHCDTCGRAWLPPGPWCPSCWSRAFRWAELSGRGTVTSLVRFHQQYYRSGPFQVPYAVAEVTLEEGPRLYGQLVQAEPEVGLAVEVCYDDVSEDLTLARFRPRGWEDSR